MMPIVKAGWVLAAALFLPTAMAQTDSTFLNALVYEHEIQAVPDLIKRELLQVEPVVPLSSLSPDGRFLAYSEKEGLQLNIKLLNTQSMLESSLFNTARLQGLFLELG